MTSTCTAGNSPLHELREWGCKQDCGIECFQQDILADRYGQAAWRTAAGWASKECSIRHETQGAPAVSAVAP